MTEVAHSGKDHRHAEIVRCGNGQVILLGSAGLNNVANSGIVSSFHVIREREEGVGTHDDFAKKPSVPKL